MVAASSVHQREGQKKLLDVKDVYMWLNIFIVQIVNKIFKIFL